MKDKMLGSFEETVLLLVGILEKDAYAFRISEEYEVQTKKPASIGAIHATLDRLNKKGLLTSEMVAPTAERGGRRKRVYKITAEGEQALIAARDFRVSLWSQFPAFSNFKFNLG